MQHRSYKDLPIRLTGSLLASHLVDAIGRPQRFWERLHDLDYYQAVVSGFVIGLILWEIVRQVTRHLDQRYDWLRMPWRRLPAQVLGAVLLPAGLSFWLTKIQMRLLFDQDIESVDWLIVEFPFVVLLVVLVNLYYFSYYLFFRWKSAQHDLEAQPAPAQPAAPTAPPPTSSLRTDVLLVNKGGQSVVLPTEEVAYIYREGDYYFIRTFGKETYVTSLPLDELMLRLPETHFFRVNRQLIANLRACKSFRSLSYGKLALDLHPPFPEEVVISQKRAPAFRQWLLQPKTS